MSDGERATANRTYVIFCAIDMRPQNMSTLDGYKLFVGNFSPEFSASPMHWTTFNNILIDLCDEVKNDIVGNLKLHRENCLEHGYEGAFCSLQVDLTTAGRMEYCTASCSIIPPDFGGVLHLALATRAFPRQHTDKHIKLWLEKLTIEYFGSFMGPSVHPSDVFICGTGAQGANVLNAYKALGVPVIVCAAHRLNASVMWALGVNGSAAAGKNREGKELISRAAGLVGVFSHSAVNNDNLQNAQELMFDRRMQQKETQAEEEAIDMESLASLAAFLNVDFEPGEIEGADDFGEEERKLTVICRNDTRFGPTHDFLRRLLELRPTVDVFFENCPSDIRRNLSGEEWLAVRQLTSLLQPASEVTTRVQGTADGFISRIILLMKQVISIYSESDHDVMAASMAKDAPPESVPLSSLMNAAQTFLRVIVGDMERRHLGAAGTTLESVALYLDPRTKGCGPDVCTNADAGIKTRAIKELARRADGMANGKDAAQFPPDNFSASSEPPPAKKPRSKLEQLELSRARRVRAAGHEGGHDSSSSQRGKLRRELEEYEASPEIGGGDGFDLLKFWKDKGMPKIDEHGKVMQRARWPILSMVARVYHSINGTRCLAERNFSQLSLSADELRSSLAPRKVEQLLFLRLNKTHIKEVKGFKDKMAKMQGEYTHARARARACAHQAKVAGEIIEV